MFRRALLSSFFFVVACGSKTPPPIDAGSTDASDASQGDGGITPCTVTPGTTGVLVTGRLLLAAGPVTGELLMARMESSRAPTRHARKRAATRTRRASIVHRA